MNEATEKRRDRAMFIVVAITGSVSAALLLLAIAVAWVGVPALIDTRSGVDQQTRSDRVSECSRKLRGPIDAANAALERAKTARDDVFLAGLTASIQGDDATVAALAEKVPQVRRQVADAQAEVDATSKAYDDASKLKPAQFLAECAKGWPRPEPDTEKVQPFTSCAEAEAAGLAPLERGDPGYSPALDRDGDGIACE